MAPALDKSSDVEIDGVADGQPIKLHWSVKPAKPSDDNAYLAQLIDVARPDKGALLPHLAPKA